MKSTFALAICLILSISSNAQRNFWGETNGVFSDFGSNGIHNISPKQREAFSKLNVKSRTTVSYSKGNSHSVTEHFDDAGYLIKREYPNSKYETVTTAEYNDEHLITKLITKNNRDEQWTSMYTYDNGRLVEREDIDEKGKYKGLKKEYDKDGNMTRHGRFDGDRNSPKHELIYTYYEDGQKESITYIKDKKVKYVWSYDCKEEGELINVKSKDQSTICVKEEVNELGYTVTWNRDFNEKGDLIKTKTVRGSQGELISEEMYNVDDRLIREVKINETGGAAYISYDKDGEISSMRESFLNQNDKLKKSIYDSKRYKYTFLYNYEGELQTQSTRIYKRGIYVSEYEYDFR